MSEKFGNTCQGFLYFHTFWLKLHLEKYMPNTIKHVKYMHDDIGLEASLRRTNKKRWCLFQARTRSLRWQGLVRNHLVKYNLQNHKLRPDFRCHVCSWANNCTQENTIIVKKCHVLFKWLRILSLDRGWCGSLNKNQTPLRKRKEK